MTLVYGASTIDECGLLRKSIDTSSASEKARMPFERSVRRFTQRVVDFRRRSSSCRPATLRSTTETFGVGTRIANPSRRPFSSGSTSPTAEAAPVVVGIIESAAARARRRSLCGRSSRFWSLVYEWMVVIHPLRMPNRSCTTLASGARQLVVHDAFEMM